MRSFWPNGALWLAVGFCISLKLYLISGGSRDMVGTYSGYLRVIFGNLWEVFGRGSEIFGKGSGHLWKGFGISSERVRKVVGKCSGHVIVGKGSGHVMSSSGRVWSRDVIVGEGHVCGIRDILTSSRGMTSGSVFVNPPPTIHYCYGAWQDGFRDMKDAGVLSRRDSWVRPSHVMVSKGWIARVRRSDGRGRWR